MSKTGGLPVNLVLNLDETGRIVKITSENTKTIQNNPRIDLAQEKLGLFDCVKCKNRYEFRLNFKFGFKIPKDSEDHEVVVKYVDYMGVPCKKEEKVIPKTPETIVFKMFYGEHLIGVKVNLADRSIDFVKPASVDIAEFNKFVVAIQSSKKFQDKVNAEIRRVKAPKDYRPKVEHDEPEAIQRQLLKDEPIGKSTVWDDVVIEYVEEDLEDIKSFLSNEATYVPTDLEPLVKNEPNAEPETVSDDEQIVDPNRESWWDKDEAVLPDVELELDKGQAKIAELRKELKVLFNGEFVKDGRCEVCGSSNFINKTTHLQKHGIYVSVKSPNDFQMGVYTMKRLLRKKRKEIADQQRVENPEAVPVAPEQHKKRSKPVKTDKPLVCEFCGFAGYKTQHGLNSHRAMVHNVGELYKCDMCPYKAHIRRNFKDHFRRTHTPKADLTLKCKYCDKRFIFPCDMKNHIKKHTEERLHVCQTCGRRYKHACDLKNHSYSHTGQFPYECLFCDRKFQDRGNKNAHQRRDHAEELKKTERMHFGVLYPKLPTEITRKRKAV